MLPATLLIHIVGECQESQRVFAAIIVGFLDADSSCQSGVPALSYFSQGLPRIFPTDSCSVPSQLATTGSWAKTHSAAAWR